ncbi:hypothetical protein KC614_01890 [candidate division WWE3 bacterium]|uniref:Uncharacterized protein n=1 Tax=candidate division WWE3 bacterium TaxID=2053526 RepID=A0A955LKM0_UNCKA|nr:hypothetical protein [candidate division WWE3 bacterium]
MYEMAIAASLPRKLALAIAERYPTVEVLVYFLNSSTDAWDTLQEQFFGFGESRAIALHQTLTTAGYRLKYKP